MKRTILLSIIVAAAGWACTNDQLRAQPTVPNSEVDLIMRDGARSGMTSTQNSFLAAACYATAVNNRGDGLAANAARIDAEERWRVTVIESRSGHPIAVVNVTPAGTGANAELFTRSRFTRGGAESFRQFLAARC
jgi:hypothetical protein